MTAPEALPKAVLPQATDALESSTAVFLRYLDSFRSDLATMLQALPAADLHRSSLPSGWTPLELLKHLTYVELRWLEWGFAGLPIAEPFADQVDGRWAIGPDEDLPVLTEALAAQALRSRAIIQAHQLDEVGQPSPRWNGATPATLERVLLHLMQEYARHLGHLDIVCELANGDGS